MDDVVPDILRFFVRFLLLTGSVFAAIWFYFRIRPKTVSSGCMPSAEGESGKEVILKLKLQACERLIMFLERIAPDNLILRVHLPDMAATQLQAAAIRTVREEFDYNLSQQLYISTSTWELIRNAKEGTISLINRAASELKDEATGRDLASAIFGLAIAQEKSSVLTAIESVKREINWD